MENDSFFMISDGSPRLNSSLNGKQLKLKGKVKRYVKKKKNSTKIFYDSILNHDRNQSELIHVEFSQFPSLLGCFFLSYSFWDIFGLLLRAKLFF